MSQSRCGLDGHDCPGTGPAANREKDDEMTRKTCTAAIFLAAIIGSTALGIGGAGAVTMRKCPDGTWVSDSQKCPKFKGRTKGKTLSVGRIGLEAATFPGLDQAPKPRRIPQKRLD